MVVLRVCLLPLLLANFLLTSMIVLLHLFLVNSFQVLWNICSGGLMYVDCSDESDDDDEVGARSRSCTSTPTLSSTSSAANMKRPSSAANMFIKKRKN